MGHHIVSGPPRIVEAVAGALLPASRREDVLGDLHERYTSPLGYVRDAVQLIPIVAISHALHRRRQVASPATVRTPIRDRERRATAAIVTWLAHARPPLYFASWFVWLSMVSAISRVRSASLGTEPDAD